MTAATERHEDFLRQKGISLGTWKSVQNAIVEFAQVNTRIQSVLLQQIRELRAE